MRASSIYSAVPEAVTSALLRDLPEHPPHHDPARYGPARPRRPREDEVEVYVFPETWGSTALGHGGMGGSTMTDAYTVLVADRATNSTAVYWGGWRLGVLVDYETGRRMAAAQSTRDFIDTDGGVRRQQRRRSGS